MLRPLRTMFNGLEGRRRMTLVDVLIADALVAIVVIALAVMYIKDYENDRKGRR